MLYFMPMVYISVLILIMQSCRKICFCTVFKENVNPTDLRGLKIYVPEPL